MAICLFIGLLYFAAFLIPNRTGARDAMMISLFEPDEFAQYPVVIRMLTPLEALDKTLLNFIAYRHYYYGSPFYFGSAVTLLPLSPAVNPGQTQLHMLLLRQLVSVLPSVAALLLLTWTHTRFRSLARSAALLVFLLTVPAVVENNLWWHADGLAFLFVALTLHFLDQDDLRFGRHFHLAAVATGLAAGTKVIGLFFGPAIARYMLMGLVRKRGTVRIAMLRAVAFVVIMLGTIIVSNPFLLLPSEFQRMLDLLTRQARAMSEGWTLRYAVGPLSWWPVIGGLYAGPPILLLSLAAIALGIWRGRRRALHLMIAAWSLPFGLYVLYTIAIKPSHFFLPILLPLMSSLAVLAEFPPFSRSEGANSARPARSVSRGSRLASTSVLWGALVLGIVGLQFASNVGRSAGLYQEVLHREQNEGSFVFYQALESEFLPGIPSEARLVVFRDVRMYFPDDPRWTVRTFWNSSYSTIVKIQPDMIILWAQRIADYTQQGAQELALDPEAFQSTYEFYVDADNGSLRGYRLLHRDSEGLFFVSESLFAEYFD